MDGLCLIGMIAFVVLMLLLLAGAWQDYKEELEKHRTALTVYDEMIDMDRRSSIERTYLQRETEAKRAKLHVVLTSEKHR
jgi:ATP:corrinoid adenosyltransferase